LVGAGPGDSNIAGAPFGSGSFSPTHGLPFAEGATVVVGFGVVVVGATVVGETATFGPPPLPAATKPSATITTNPMTAAAAPNRRRRC